MRNLPWRWPDGSSARPRRCEEFARALGLPDVIGEALASRKPDAFDPEALALRSLGDCTAAIGEPDNTDKAAARLLHAARTGRVGILCDFDVDGATAQAILVETLRLARGPSGQEPAVAVPERNTEGFGPNERCLELLANAGVTCIAVLDCGTAAGGLLDGFHQATGIDVVVIDHHPAHGAQAPTAGVLLNPWATSPASPGERGTLCTAALTWFVARSVLRQAGLSKAKTKAVRQRITLYAALGTSCDLMPLDMPFNRSLIRHGVRLLSDTASRSNGLAEICEIANIGSTCSADDFGWRIGPRLNAGSRMGESDLAARCLRESDRDAARDFARRLDQHNQDRKELGRKARAELASHSDLEAFDRGPVNVFIASSATPGTVGLVASELVKLAGWPAIALSQRENGALAGSGRSALEFNIGEAVVAAVRSGIARKGGGHAAACGVEIDSQRLEDLRDFLANRFRQHAANTAIPCEPSRVIDAVLRPNHLAADALLALAQAQQRLEPWGPGLEFPQFGVRECSVTRHKLTANGHLFATLECVGNRFEAVWWSAPEDWQDRLAANDPSGNRAEVAGTVELDSWNGRYKGRFVIADARVPQG
ncbi:MAG: hypothetical protein F4Y47_14410 [Acidobacteriia bacterium]|nr:hypothetical protein [Terriglobia bacterium]MYK09615.1 hypothetical protein [Terriglobia bacterium]